MANKFLYDLVSGVTKGVYKKTRKVQKRATAAAKKGAKQAAATNVNSIIGRLDAGMASRQAAQSQQNKVLDSLLKSIDQMMARQERIAAIDPNVKITPQVAANFLSQARKELSPYYKELTSQAITDLRRNTTYYKKTQAAIEQALEREYGRSFDELTQNMVSAGFGYSGRRIKQERELATETQEDINQRRRSLMNQMQAAGSEFERTYGSQAAKRMNMGNITIAGTPTVQAGQRNWVMGQETQPLYKLSGNVLGTLQKEYSTAARTRKEELESAWREKEYNKKIRQITLGY